MHHARRDSARCSHPCGAATLPLGRQHLEHVTVRISKVKTASAATVIDLHVVERAGTAAISNALGADAVEDAVKLRLVDFEGIVVTLEIRVIVEIEGQCVVGNGAKCESGPS